MLNKKRLAKLEAKAQESEGQALELYDIHGDKIDARIVKMPTAEEYGMARLESGETMEIAPEIGWREVILATADIEERPADYELTPDNLIFMRRNGQAGAMEIIYTCR